MAEKTTTPTETVTEETAAPAKRGRKQTRDPNGKQVGAFFSEAEYKRLRDARFDERLDKDAELIHKAVVEYLDKNYPQA